MMAELTKEGKKFISKMLDEIMFARRIEELMSGVDVKEIDKSIQDESMRLMEKYGKMGKLTLLLRALSSKAEADKEIERILKEKENAPLD